jgi:hypothetical protein
LTLKTLVTISNLFFDNYFYILIKKQKKCLVFYSNTPPNQRDFYTHSNQHVSNSPGKPIHSSASFDATTDNSSHKNEQKLENILNLNMNNRYLSQYVYRNQIVCALPLKKSIKNIWSTARVSLSNEIFKGKVIYWPI